MGFSLLITAASVVVLVCLFKINCWLVYRKKINKYQEFKIYYPKPDFIGTSSTEKKRFMRTSNQLTVACIAVLVVVLLVWWVLGL